MGDLPISNVAGSPRQPQPTKAGKKSRAGRRRTALAGKEVLEMDGPIPKALKETPGLQILLCAIEKVCNEFIKDVCEDDKSQKSQKSSNSVSGSAATSESIGLKICDEGSIGAVHPGSPASNSSLATSLTQNGESTPNKVDSVRSVTEKGKRSSEDMSVETETPKPSVKRVRRITAAGSEAQGVTEASTAPPSGGTPNKVESVRSVTEKGQRSSEDMSVETETPNPSVTHVRRITATGSEAQVISEASTAPRPLKMRKPAVPVSCSVDGCKVVLSSGKCLARHINSCHALVKKSVPCGYGSCTRTFARREYLRDHYYYAHGHPARHPCQFCKQGYRRPGALKKHVAKCHPDAQAQNEANN